MPLPIPPPVRPGLHPYPHKPFNPGWLLAAGWLCVIVGIGGPILILIWNWLKVHIPTLSTLETALIFGAVSAISLTVGSLMITSLVVVHWQYRRRLAHWRQQVAAIRQDRVRAWQADLAEWFRALSRPASSRHPLAGGLTDAGLEHLAAELFAKVGYQTQVVGGSGDKGVDVHMLNPRGEVEIVQCKQWAKPVGSPEVLHFIGAMQKAGAVYGYIVAPHGFTGPAQADVVGYNILLADESALQHLMDIVERYAALVY